MPVVWNLREWLKKRGITRASEVRRIVRERTGYPLSNQAVCNLLNDQPKMVRIETSQALCDAFYCCLSDFFEVKPKAVVRAPRQTHRPSHHLRHTEAGISNSGSPEISDDKTGVDFAAFFPDAKEYSHEGSEDAAQSSTPDGNSRPARRGKR